MCEFRVARVAAAHRWFWAYFGAPAVAPEEYKGCSLNSLSPESSSLLTVVKCNKYGPNRSSLRCRDPRGVSEFNPTVPKIILINIYQNKFWMLSFGFLR